MIRIEIGNETRELNDADEQWINQQINMRRADGENVCVRVTIKEGELNMVVATPSCGGDGSGARPPTADESRIFDLWDKRGLSRQDFTGGNVIAFLAQLQQSI